MSLFSRAEAVPDDPILSISIDYSKDPRPNKVNLGVGCYKNADGNPSIVSAVIQAEQATLDHQTSKEYLPILGPKEFGQHIFHLLFGNTPPIDPNTVAISATLAGTGALRIGGEYLKDLGLQVCYIPDKTWPNHSQIFARSGLTLQNYPYYDAQNKALQFDAMMATLKQAPKESVVVLQTACHNPTGIDPSHEQWEALCELIKAKEIFPIFDTPYQGFGDGFQEDVFPFFRSWK